MNYKKMAVEYAAKSKDVNVKAIVYVLLAILEKLEQVE